MVGEARKFEFNEWISPITVFARETEKYRLDAGGSGLDNSFFNFFIECR